MGIAQISTDIGSAPRVGGLPWIAPAVAADLAASDSHQRESMSKYEHFECVIAPSQKREPGPASSTIFEHETATKVHPRIACYNSGASGVRCRSRGRHGIGSLRTSCT